MIIGIFKAIRRVLVSAGLNLFYLSRLDVPLTVKGWEFLDRGIILVLNISYLAIFSLW